MNDFLNSVFGTLGSSIPNFLFALALFIVAIICKNASKKAVEKLLAKLNFQSLLEKWGLGDSKDIIPMISGLVSLLVFILFLPGIFSYLNLEFASQPIQNMLSIIMAYIPKVFGAVLLFVIGLYFAKFVKEISKPILKKLGVDKLQDKIGINESSEASSFSSIISNVIYFVILVPIVIAALGILDIRAISDPAVSVLSSVIEKLPIIFIAIITLVVGVKIASLVSDLIAGILDGVGLNNVMSKFSFVKGDSLKKINLVAIIRETIKYVIIWLIAAQALETIEFGFLQSVAMTIIAFFPTLLVGVLLFFAGYILICWIEGVLQANFSASKTVTTVVKAIMMVFLVSLVLNQVGVDISIINLAISVLLIASGVAGAIAFGYGGRGVAEKLLNKWYNKNNKEQ